MKSVPKTKAVPFFGTYRAPDGNEVQLCRASDVYDLFRALLKRMPDFPIVRDARHPERGVFRVMPDGDLVKLP